MSLKSMKNNLSLQKNSHYLLTLFTALAAVLFSLQVAQKEILWGEIGMSKWMYENTPSFIDFLGDVIDAPITDIGAPIAFYRNFYTRLLALGTLRDSWDFISRKHDWIDTTI